MKVAVIGAKGTVGRTLVEHFGFLGHEVLSVDRDTTLTLKDAAAAADVVFIVTLPIEEVAGLVAKAASVMRPGTFLIHGTSIEKPARNEVDVKMLLARDITLCHLHFHFRPETPLRRTLFGQNITISGCGAGWFPEQQWGVWVCKQFMPFRPGLHRLKDGIHDQLTSVSQLIHMIVAVLVSRMWSDFHPSITGKALEIGGPPCKLLARSVLRTGLGAKVTEDILHNHPLAPDILLKFQEAVASLQVSVQNENLREVEKWLLAGRAVAGLPEDIKRWDDTTARLVRLEADMQRSRLEFRFSPEANVPGLLARVLKEFDDRGVDKTTTIAQVNPDGGCTFVIGLREMSVTAREAEQVVRNWT